MLFIPCILLYYNFKKKKQKCNNYDAIKQITPNTSSGAESCGCLCAQPGKYKQLHMCNSGSSSLCGGGVRATWDVYLEICNFEFLHFKTFNL
jgi:hypothetical protein